MRAICEFFFLTLQFRVLVSALLLAVKLLMANRYLVFSMIKSLHIENYALISRLDIVMHKGFSVVTGETGAGKSIILGAIGLLKGQRADVKAIKTGEKRCVVEAEFDVSSYDLKKFFELNDLDFDGSECVIRRELTISGKSRAFINDTPVTASLLKVIGDKLIDVHSQHQNLLLNTEDFQIRVLDIIADSHDVLTEYQSLYDEYRSAQARLNKAIEDSRRSHEDEDYWRFQYEQLKEAALSEDNEQVLLERESEVLEHTEEIRSELFKASELIGGESGDDRDNVLTALKRSLSSLVSITDKFRDIEPLAERLDSCYIELKDILDEIDSASDRIESNPLRLQEIQERLNLIYTLERKHNVDSVAELKSIRQELEQRLHSIDHSEQLIEELRKKLQTIHSEAVAKAVVLSEKRKCTTRKIEELMVARLQSLGMPNVRFVIDIQSDVDSLTRKGADSVTFLFSANKNGLLQDVAKVASGGEVARVMLSLKSLIADAVKLPTIIFDEIDTGVSGKIAEKMAEIMYAMGENGRQVVSITHLPQIASLGSHHFRVFKDENGDMATSKIIELCDEERVDEIAHMLSGSEITDAAIANAKELLNNKR